MSPAPDALRAALKDRYRIERELGAGGMATVYLAEDIKHRRQVAVKVFRPELAATLGPDRFAREIEVAARLQHPHILPLHDSGEAGGFFFYVMPFVEGTSLRERLTQQGELPIVDAIRILTELVEAVAYAHRQGVVHRDLKPDNIMLSGRHPMVMDFGIAKAVSAATGTQGATTAGLALGTPAYMAPEQAVADPQLDHRVDIYAMGVIGYELLTGQTPFPGLSPQQTLAAHVSETPRPISMHRATVPPALNAVLMRCLQKRPADRPQTAEELLVVLEALSTPSGGLTPTGALPLSRATAVRRRLAPMLAAATVVVAVAIGVPLWRRAMVPDVLPVARHSQLTFNGNAKLADISPDGQWLAYLEDGDTGRIVVRDLAGTAVIPVFGPIQQVFSLRWVRGGESLLFSGQATTFAVGIIPRLGGVYQQILTGPRPYTLVAPDGQSTFSWGLHADQSFVFGTLAQAESLRVVPDPDPLSWRIGGGDWSRDGRRIVIVTRGKSGIPARLWVLDVPAASWQLVLTDSTNLSSPRWAADGRALYFLRGTGLWRLRLNAQGGPDGSPVRLQDELSANQIALTADGMKLAYSKVTRASNLWIATLASGQRQFTTRQLTRGTALHGPGVLSPDGRQIAYLRGEGRTADLFVLPIEGGEPRLVSSGAAVGPPAWSPDGSQLALLTVEGTSARVRVVSLANGNGRTFRSSDPSPSASLLWAPQRRLLYQRPGNRNYHWLDPDSEVEEPLVSNDSVGWMFNPVPSPDGQSLAVHWNRADRDTGRSQPGAYILSADGESQQFVQRGHPVGWSVDGKHVFVLSPENNAIYRVPRAGGRGTFVGVLPWDNADCSVTERGQDLLFLCSVVESTSDIWMLEDFDPDVPRAKRK